MLSIKKTPMIAISLAISVSMHIGAANAAVSTGPERNLSIGSAEHQLSVDQYWHGPGYYPGPYHPYRPYRPPVYVYPAPGPVIVAPPPPVYAYPAPVIVAPPAPVVNQVVCRGSNNGAVLGGAIGGATGAAIGASASRHHPWEAAAGGAILGILLGSAVGHAADAGDQYCTTQAVVAAPVGQPVYWTNPTYGMQYQIVPTRQYQRWGTTCRDYQASTVMNGQWQQIRGTMCLQLDGSWQMVGG